MLDPYQKLDIFGVNHAQVRQGAGQGFYLRYGLTCLLIVARSAFGAGRQP